MRNNLIKIQKVLFQLNLDNRTYKVRVSNKYSLLSNRAKLR